MRRRARGFTLVEVLVALMVVAIGLTALMVSVSGTARTSGYLREKTLAQWIALNRIAEVRLNTNKFSSNTDTAELDFASRTWHYDTRYFDTSMATMKRVVVRVYAGDKKTKGNPLAETTSFLSTAMAPPAATVDWTAGSSLPGTGSIGTPAATVTTPPAATTVPGTTTTVPSTTPAPVTTTPQ